MLACMNQSGMRCSGVFFFSVKHVVYSQLYVNNSPPANHPLTFACFDLLCLALGRRDNVLFLGYASIDVNELPLIGLAIRK